LASAGGAKVVLMGEAPLVLKMQAARGEAVKRPP